MPDSAVRDSTTNYKLGSGSLVVSSPVDRREGAASMTRAFRLILTMLSLSRWWWASISFFRRWMARSCGGGKRSGSCDRSASRRSWIRRAWLLEAALPGAARGALGALLGWAGAQLSVRLVGRTVNALYYRQRAVRPGWTGPSWPPALVLAVAASLLAGWMPARAAARTPPAQIGAARAGAPPGLSIWRKEWLGLAFAGRLWSGPFTAAALCGGMRFPWRVTWRAYAGSWVEGF